MSPIASSSYAIEEMPRYFVHSFVQSYGYSSPTLGIYSGRKIKTTNDLLCLQLQSSHSDEILKTGGEVFIVKKE